MKMIMKTNVGHIDYAFSICGHCSSHRYNTRFPQIPHSMTSPFYDICHTSVWNPQYRSGQRSYVFNRSKIRWSLCWRAHRGYSA